MAGAFVVDVEDLRKAQVQFKALVETVGPSLEGIVIAAQSDAGGDAAAHEFIDRLNDQRRQFQALTEVFNDAIAQLNQRYSDHERY
jgi:ABC-type transporter Mla subunit MlaD